MSFGLEMTSENRTPTVIRICVECGSDTTYCYPKRGEMYEHWYNAEPFGKEGLICEKCRRRLRRRMGLDKWGNNRLISELSPDEQEKRRKFMREYAREMRALNPDHFRKYNKNRNIQIKIKLMQILNQDCCVYCGYSLFPALHIDHRGSFGRQDMKRFGKSSISMKEYYIKHPEEARQKLQVCCSNCNWLKRWCNGEDATLGIIPKQTIKLSNSKAPFFEYMS